MEADSHCTELVNALRACLVNAVAYMRSISWPNQKRRSMVSTI